METKYTFYRNKAKKRHYSSLKLSINDSGIVRAESMKFLGIFLDISCKTHIKYFENKS